VMLCGLIGKYHQHAVFNCRAEVVCTNQPNQSKSRTMGGVLCEVQDNNPCSIKL
jgi:hypothetical protein